MIKNLILIFLISFNISYSQWERFSDSINTGYLFDFEILKDRIYTVTEKGVFSSSNNGLDWVENNIGIDLNFAFYGELASIDSTLFVSFINKWRGYMFRSDDFGNSWNRLNNWNLDDAVNAFNSSGSTLYVSTEFHRGVLYSTDLGLNWNKLLTSFSSDTITLFLISKSYFLAESTRDYFLSKDYGTSWKSLDIIIKGNIWSAFHAVGNNLFLAIDTTFHISTNQGEDWFKKEIIRWGRSERIQCFTNVGSAIFAGGWYGVYMSLDTGRTWLNVVSDTSSGVVQEVVSLAVKDGYLFAGTNHWGGFRAKISDLIALVGVKEGLNLHKGNNPIIAPNPAEDFIEINLDGWAAANIKVFNALGECVLTASDARQRKRIDLSALPAGMYFLTIQSGGQSVKEQFAVMR